MTNTNICGRQDKTTLSIIYLPPQASMGGGRLFLFSVASLCLICLTSFSRAISFSSNARLFLSNDTACAGIGGGGWEGGGKKRM